MGGSLSSGAPLEELLEAALRSREALLAGLAARQTDCCRLFHGATEGRPGLAIDRYGPVLLVQTWGEALEDGVLERLASLVSERLGEPLVPVWNHRGAGKKQPFSHWSPAPDLSGARAREEGLEFLADPRHGGRDPLLFLDFRAGRRRLRAEAEGCSVLNLFAYTCSAGVAALAGGASGVWNVDFSASALEFGRRNGAANGIPAERMTPIQEDALVATRQLAGLPVKGRGARRRRFTRLEARQFDRVVLDPPRWATSAFGAVDLVRDYPGVFKPALLATRPGGRMLVTNNVAEVDLQDWLGTLERCGVKAGRPIESVEVIEPDEDFPSPDGKHPLKMAWLGV